MLSDRFIHVNICSVTLHAKLVADEARSLAATKMLPLLEVYFWLDKAFIKNDFKKPTPLITDVRQYAIS